MRDFTGKQPSRPPDCFFANSCFLSNSSILWHFFLFNSNGVKKKIKCQLALSHSVFEKNGQWKKLVEAVCVWPLGFSSVSSALLSAGLKRLPAKWLQLLQKKWKSLLVQVLVVCFPKENATGQTLTLIQSWEEAKKLNKSSKESGCEKKCSGYGGKNPKKKSEKRGVKKFSLKNKTFKLQISTHEKFFLKSGINTSTIRH